MWKGRQKGKRISPKYPLYEFAETAPINEFFFQGTV